MSTGQTSWRASSAPTNLHCHGILASSGFLGLARASGRAGSYGANDAHSYQSFADVLAGGQGRGRGGNGSGRVAGERVGSGGVLCAIYVVKIYLYSSYTGIYLRSARHPALPL